MSIKVVLLDLDCTVADTRHRAHLAPEDKTNTQNWINYSKACVEDIPLAGPIRTVQLLSEQYPIFVVSGRNTEARAETLSWMIVHKVPFTRMRLHNRYDIRHNGEYKAAYVRELRAQGYDPILMLEDHEEVSRLVEAEGVPVLTVNPRFTDTIGVSFNVMGGVNTPKESLV